MSFRPQGPQLLVECWRDPPRFMEGRGPSRLAIWIDLGADFCCLSLPLEMGGPIPHRGTSPLSLRVNCSF